MKPLLIIGLDSIVGANAAAHFNETIEVQGYALQQLVHITNCKSLGLLKSGVQSNVVEILDKVDPCQILFVPPVGSSAWFNAETAILNDSMIDEVRTWAIAAQKRQIPLTLISSDNVFTGPWMFHEEDSTSLSTNKQAVLTRILESEVLAWHPEALVIRTNVFGWTPNGLPPSWIELLIQGNDQGVSRQLDTLRNGTPLAAGEFMKLLENSWSKGLCGIYHISGAERCHPVRLAQKISEVFGLGWKCATGINDVRGVKNSLRFGFGETSLQTKKIRHALQLPMPMLEDSVEQLYAEYQNGFAERIRTIVKQLSAKAA